MGIYSLDRVRADLMSLDEALQSLSAQIAAAWVGSSDQQGAAAADLTKAEADLNAALAVAVASATDSFASVEQGVQGAVADTQAAFVRVAGETAIGLGRGVTDAINSDAGNNLAVFALGSITHAAYTAGGNVVLVSLSDIVNNAGSTQTLDISEGVEVYNLSATVPVWGCSTIVDSPVTPSDGRKTWGGLSR